MNIVFLCPNLIENLNWIKLYNFPLTTFSLIQYQIE